MNSDHHPLPPFAYILISLFSHSFFSFFSLEFSSLCSFPIQTPHPHAHPNPPNGVSYFHLWEKLKFNKLGACGTLKTREGKSGEKEKMH
jgi:hypothetical protein